MATAEQRRPVRIGNCSGFYGDRLAAMREMLDGGPLDVLTGDYLAELTMLILARAQTKDPTKGYATTFLRQLEDCLGTAAAQGVRIVANAGGVNPAGCAEAVRTLADRLGLTAAVSYVDGDDVRGRFPEEISANAYLGAFPLARALDGGADVVITGRCTDAALVCGPAAWWHGWTSDDLDQLAGAVVAGHVIECGAQATGGNYSFFTEVPDLLHAGFPIAEVASDGSSVITKHEGTGGLVSVDTVIAQLLYEITQPDYLGPDVTARFVTIRLTPAGPDRVAIDSVLGARPPSTIKVVTNRLGGFRNSVTFLLCGLDIEAKAELVTAQMRPALDAADSAQVDLVRLDRPDADTEEGATALLRMQVKAADAKRIGRSFSSPAIELALASIPGFHVTAPPGDAVPFGVYAPQFLPRDEVVAVVHHHDGRAEEVAFATPRPVREYEYGGVALERPGPLGDGPTRRVPLGAIAGARSGDKGGDANVGVWVRTDDAYGWLRSYLTEERLRALLPEAAGLPLRLDALPRIRAVNVVITGLLGEGVASSTRFDPQAKALGEWLRSRLVDVPVELLSRRG